MRNRLLAVHDDQIDDNVNEPPPSDFRAVGQVIHLCNDISFPHSSNRATLLPTSQGRTFHWICAEAAGRIRK